MSKLNYTFCSQILDMNVTVNIILPEPIHKGEKFKTLYLLHGYMGDYTDWTRFTSVERYNWKYRYAIIMPAVQNSYYTDTAYGHRYLSFITKELPEVMENTFPLSKKGSDRHIGGLSMGGYGAIKSALLYPKRYQKAFSLSGALDISHIQTLTRDSGRKTMFDSVFGKKNVFQTKHDLFFLTQKNIDKDILIPDMFIACGKEDFLYESNKKFHLFLDEKKIKHQYIVDTGVHDWDFWDRFLISALEWLNK